jgi:hypothetical protein
MLHYKYINPGLMIADNQIPAFIIQTIQSLHIPPCFLSKTHPSAVAGNPNFPNPVKNPVDYPEQRRPG